VVDGFRGRPSRFSVEEPPDTGPRGFSEAMLRHHSRRLSRYSEISAVTSGCAPIGAPATLRLTLPNAPTVLGARRAWTSCRRPIVLRRLRCFGGPLQIGHARLDVLDLDGLGPVR